MLPASKVAVAIIMGCLLSGFLLREIHMFLTLLFLQ